VRLASIASPANFGGYGASVLPFMGALLGAVVGLEVTSVPQAARPPIRPNGSVAPSLSNGRFGDMQARPGGKR
jgi:hypothetical protein